MNFHYLTSCRWATPTARGQGWKDKKIKNSKNTGQDEKNINTISIDKRILWYNYN